MSIEVLENNGTAVGNAVGVGTGTASSRATGVDGSFTINGTQAIVDGLDIKARAGDLALDITLTTAFAGGTSVDGLGNATATTTFEITGGGARFSISPTVGLSGLEAIGIAELSTAKLGNQGVGFLSTLGSGLANDLSSKNFTSIQ